MTVYYPLKEKQSIEILSISLEKEALILNYEIKTNKKRLDEIKSLKLDENNSGRLRDNIKEIEGIHFKNNKNQIALEKKYEEIKIRKKHIKLYSILFWFFFPVGIGLTIFGFVKWLNAKKTDDKKSELDKDKLELEVKKLRNEVL